MSRLYKILTAILFSLSVQSSVAQDTASTFLLEPTGPYTIGTAKYFLTDSSRCEPFMPKSKKRIYVKVWYPSDEPTNGACSNYLEGYDKKAIYDIFKSKGISIEKLESLSKMSTYSCPNIPISDTKKQFPVIIFSAGYYFGMVDLYSSFLENLASNGYIVCAVTHLYEQPYVVFPSGEEVFLAKKKAQLNFLQLIVSDFFQFRDYKNSHSLPLMTKYSLRTLRRFDKSLRDWVEDVKFAVAHFEHQQCDNQHDALISSLDLTNIGAFGQSFGGALSGQLCYVDSRIKAGVNMDCFQFGDIYTNSMDKPIMLVESDYKEKWNYGNTCIYQKVNSFYRIHIPRSNHFLFSDVSLMPVIDEQEKRGLIGNVDGPQSIKLLNKYILDFFNVYLKGYPVEILTQEVNSEEFNYKFRID